MRSIREMGGAPLPGYQLRYIRFLDPSARERLAVPVIPFAEIAAKGAGMYRGQSVSRVKRPTGADPAPAGRFDSDPPAPT